MLLFDGSAALRQMKNSVQYAASSPKSSRTASAPHAAIRIVRGVICQPSSQAPNQVSNIKNSGAIVRFAFGRIHGAILSEARP
jgi:hypothetical protein